MDGSYKRLSSTGYKAVSVYSAFLLLAGSCTQLIMFIVLLKREYRKKILTPCFLSIIASNFLLLYGSLPFTFVSSVMKGWIFNDKICHFVGFVAGTGSVSMIATMAVITVKIYLLVKNKPFVGNRIERDNSQTKVLLGVWLYSVCAMLPPLTGITEMSIEGAGTNCVPQWSPENTSGRVYVMFLLTMAYIIPVSVSTIYLAKIRKVINKNTSESNYYFVNLCFRNLRNINKMCMFAIVFFTIAWLPYAIVVVICMFGKKSSISPEIEMAPTLLAKTSAICNPFIYAIVNPK
ncbi:melanopsin-B-like [Actinia tenebrosa]|uniref:Melanopsin-B-like n=1 Tax=Actinia tenebrosa TaxID=6105 RepID=A0A6P8I9S6_ACTTE|nr:melanopsin-B-like [Actinia tenebrosa]